MTEPNSSYLGCAEPSWAKTVPEPQLRGMLTLAALMSERVYLSDVHVGDNINFLESFRRRRRLGLYTQLRQLVENDVVRLLLRDASIRPRTDNVRPVSSFIDVYRNWLAQDAASAWIVPPSESHRAAFLQDLDSWVPSQGIERYSYLDIKHAFIESVRRAALSPYARDWILGPSHAGGDLLRDYESLVERDWFSLADLYALFQDRGLPASSPPMLLHGLLNEAAYSKAAGSSLIGANLFGVPLERVVWPEAPGDERRPATVPSPQPVEALLERAQQVLEAPDLSIVALLQADEILELRSTVGRSYFDLLNLTLDPVYLAAQSNFGPRMAEAAALYWREIADYLARVHPSVTHRPRKLALYLQKLPIGIGDRLAHFFSFAVNVGVPVLGEVAGPGIGTAAEAAGEIASHVSLRFLFFTESDELKRIRTVLPNKAWLAKADSPTLPQIART